MQQLTREPSLSKLPSSNTATGSSSATRKPDPAAEDWASKNEWFGQDETMTLAAFNIHRKLIEEEGFDHYRSHVL